MDSLALYVAADAARTRPGWRAIASFRFEIVLFLLLLTTLAAVRFQDVFLARTIVIEPNSAARYHPRFYGDVKSGGTSTLVSDPRAPLKWSCTLRPTFTYPYCSYALLFDTVTPNRGLDLSGFQSITLDLDYAGPWDAFRLYLKNFDSRYSRPGLSDTLKFNKVEVPARKGHSVVQLNLSDLGVADWWVTGYKIRPEMSTTQLNNVTELEFQTGSGATPGTYHFGIRKITLRGRWISEATWYVGILTVWALLIGLYLVYRIVHLRRDLEQRRQSQAAALRLARYAEETARRDHLTKISNRTGVIDHYHSMAMNRDVNDPFAVLLLDVDHFKLVNDGFGHACGDQVLATVAAVLTQNVGPGDMVGRWGGEEFLLIIGATSPDGAVTRADTLRAAIENQRFGSVGKVTVSIGICFCPELADPLELVVSRADTALYAAKEDGRNRAILYHPLIREAA